MDENGIKAAVLTRIRRQLHGRALPVVTTEFSLNGTGIRADLAVLSRHFVGIEIKSASDSLKRLPSQMEGYARYFDRTEVVVAPKHVRGLENIDLYNAEVWSYEANGGWTQHISGQPQRIAGHWLLQLLTAEEEKRAVKALEARSNSEISSDNDTALRIQFEAAFRRRYAKTSAAFWDAVRGRAIGADDLVLLSRFHATRERAKSFEEAEQAMWATWAEQMNAVAARC